MLKMCSSHHCVEYLDTQEVRGAHDEAWQLDDFLAMCHWKSCAREERRAKGPEVWPLETTALKRCKCTACSEPSLRVRGLLDGSGILVLGEFFPSYTRLEEGGVIQV